MLVQHPKYIRGKYMGQFTRKGKLFYIASYSHFTIPGLHPTKTLPAEDCKLIPEWPKWVQRLRRYVKSWRNLKGAKHVSGSKGK